MFGNMRCRKELKPAVQSLTDVEAARAAVFDAQQKYFAAGTNVDHAFKEYVAKCFPYVARIPEIYDHLVLSDVTEVMGALEQIVGTVIRYEPAAQAGSHAAQS